MESVTSFGTFTVYAGAFQWRRPGRRQEMRGGDKGDHGRVRGRGPKYSLRQGGQVWPGREIATPNAVAHRGSRARPPHRQTPARDIVCNSLRSDEDIPRQGLRQKAHRKRRSCQDRAIEMLRASCSSSHRRCAFGVGRIAGRNGPGKALIGHRAMPWSHHLCIRPASVWGSAQKKKIALPRHPARSGQMALMDSGRPPGLPRWIDSKDDPDDFPPVGAIAVGVEQTRIQFEMGLVVSGEVVAGRSGIVIRLDHGARSLLVSIQDRILSGKAFCRSTVSRHHAMHISHRVSSCCRWKLRMPEPHRRGPRAGAVRGPGLADQSAGFQMMA